MATDPYDDILKRAREELSDRERERLAGELTRRADERPADDARTLYDALRQRGIIASITDAPADLSTNPTHMERFGKDAQ